MTAKRTAFALLIAIGVTILLLVSSASRVEARRGTPAPVPPTVDNDDIGGMVTSEKGPEAGVWVIAETTDLPTRFVKIVVTDDNGRYVLPDLPKANYKLWVRGYGLVDSKPVESSLGKTVNLKAVIAPSQRAAAQYYPANYWYSLVEVPPKSDFPMEREGIKSQLEWISTMKTAIQFYQIGDKATREIPERLGKFNSPEEALDEWTQDGESPINFAAGRLPKPILTKMYTDWLNRVAAGEVPPQPPRPQGVERNVVITEWDWGNDKSFVHDVTVTDERNPTLNSNGLVYGPEQYSTDTIDVLDPVHNSWSQMPVPMRDETMRANWSEQGWVKGKNGDVPMTWGNETARPAKMRLHNMMMDPKGRLWITGRFRKGEDQPDFCKAGSSQPSAKFFPIARNNDLEVELYDPELRSFKLIDTCFGTMHLEFAEDPGNTLWFSGGAQVIGWLNTKVYEETGDAAKAQGWCPYVLDTNGNGKVDEYVSPDDSVDPNKDKRIRGGSYGIGYNPVDGSVWEGSAGNPGFILRISPGSNPPYTCLTEIYNSPKGATVPKGVYVDRSSGLVWVAFAGSGQFASFDRRKCKVLNGPTATGDHCPEGWTLYPQPGPTFKNANDVTAEWYYLNWVDQFNFLGLGKNVPVAPGTNSDSVVALLPGSKKFVVLRVPYPLGFYSRGMDGRIDDPNAGWKGRALWTNYASISPWNMEGGKGQKPKVVKFQIRPDPLAN